ncbi:hypothetical protein ACLOJK_004228, partial [Asimina triloba]
MIGAACSRGITIRHNLTAFVFNTATSIGPHNQRAKQLQNRGQQHLHHVRSNEQGRREEAFMGRFAVFFKSRWAACSKRPWASINDFSNSNSISNQPMGSVLDNIPINHGQQQAFQKIPRMGREHLPAIKQHFSYGQHVQEGQQHFPSSPN